MSGLTQSGFEEDRPIKRCRAMHHGQRCDLPHRHRGYHHAWTSETREIEWADLWKLLVGDRMWTTR